MVTMICDQRNAGLRKCRIRYAPELTRLDTADCRASVTFLAIFSTHRSGNRTRGCVGEGTLQDPLRTDQPIIKVQRKRLSKIHLIRPNRLRCTESTRCKWV